MAGQQAADRARGNRGAPEQPRQADQDRPATAGRPRQARLQPGGTGGVRERAGEQTALRPAGERVAADVVPLVVRAREAGLVVHGFGHTTCSAGTAVYDTFGTVADLAARGAPRAARRGPARPGGLGCPATPSCHSTTDRPGELAFVLRATDLFEVRGHQDSHGNVARITVRPVDDPDPA